jgi:hypothetical protein
MVIGLPVARATMTSGRLRPFCANFLTGDGRSILPHLHMPPSPAVSGGDLSCVKLASDPIETCVAGRLDVPNDRQDVGRKLRRLRLTATWRCSTARACQAIFRAPWRAPEAERWS